MATSSSPDSSISISSLLASCSLSSSRSDGDRTAASIQYKDRLYDSATKALEDYIVDYEASSTGKITVQPSPALITSPRRVNSSVRHKRSLTRSRYVPRDPDLLSLTTDDLLGFPTDGSLSFSQASERKRRKNLKKEYGFSPNVAALTSPLTSSSLQRTDIHALDPRDHRLRFQDLQKCRGKSQRDYLLRETDRENHSGLDNNSTSLLYKSYPRWLTSQRSELGVSGITSIPDVKYPVWLRDHRLLDDVDSHVTRTLHRVDPVTKIPQYQLPGCSSLNFSDHSQLIHYDQRGYKMVNSGNLTNSRKHSARSHLDILENLHTPVKNHPVPESEQAGGIIHQDTSQQLLPNNQSPRTEEVLEAERSWEKVPYSYKSPVHVLCEDEEIKRLKAFKSNLVEGFLKDCVQQENTISTEAESEIQRVDQEIFPVNKSLQKALQHLSRLKELVGDCDLKKKEDSKQDLPT
ncbi:lung adenoma susceptibility protein 2 isoform X2 [Hyla sarda]|uniref:lung adenoma susceptibility protein 2 isoform X2 n=1 Tax=Hyla sarda TaxID=327740 RepID=UPI0024C2800A|nr:lung adenoma susceptibility protein 2 isoform X2 [Hyla sarda]